MLFSLTESTFIPGNDGLSALNFEMSFSLTGKLIPLVFRVVSYCFKEVRVQHSRAGHC